jgi:hypothetical protein
MLFNMSIVSTLLAHKQIIAAIAALAVVAAYVIPFDAITEAFAARGGGGGGGGGGHGGGGGGGGGGHFGGGGGGGSGGGGCKPYCHVMP